MPKSKKKGQKKDLDYYIKNFTNYNVRIPWNIFVFLPFNASAGLEICFCI